MSHDPNALFPAGHPLAGLEDIIDQVRDVSRLFYDRGWSVGTSSNYSVVLQREPLEILITASGKDKRALRRGDFVRVGGDGEGAYPKQPKASAETLLHVVSAMQPHVGAVLHTHSVWSTVLSDVFFDQGGLEIKDYEMLKGLEGVPTHQYSAWVPIFDNTQRMQILAKQVREQLSDTDRPLKHGYLIRKHGLYTWGEDLFAARRHVEVFEFLFECVARRLMLAGKIPALTQ